GYVGLIQKSTREYLVPGGTVTIDGSRDIVVPDGVTINVSGGYVSYTGGMVETTRLLGADGHIYDIAKADPLISYVGIAGRFTQDHTRRGVTETWSNPLIAGGHYEPGYLVGADAGALTIAGQPNNISGGGIVYFDGQMIADTVNGQRQIVGSQPAGGGKLTIASQGNLIVSAEGQR